MTRLVTADGPAALHQAGNFEKSGNGDLINGPEIGLNIGGLSGRGRRLDSVTDWDPTTNEDGTAASLALGDDVYIYAVPSGNGDGQANLLASKNATVPDGFTAATSRKVSGFHFGRTRPLSEAHNSAYSPPTEIVWNSVWDLLNRPALAPVEGMARLKNGWWISIYLLSVGSGAGNETVPVSRYNATPIKDDVFARRDLPSIAANNGFFIPTASLFEEYAEGAPEGNDNDNDTAWADTSNSGPTATGTVAKAVSSWNIVDAAGNLFDWLDEQYNIGSGFSHRESDADVGMYSGANRGTVYSNDWRCAGGGGRFVYGAQAGSGALYWLATPGDAFGDVGLRGASGPLIVRA